MEDALCVTLKGFFAQCHRFVVWCGRIFGLAHLHYGATTVPPVWWIVFLPERGMQLNGESVEANYSIRDGNGRNGKTTGGYKGKYIITLLKLDGQVGDDAKYSVQLENCGPVTKVGDRLKDVKVESKVKTLRKYREAKAAAGLK